MKNYNIVVWNQKDKCETIEAIRATGAVLTGVSGYYEGYYIQLDATPEQAEKINNYLQGGATC